jgi:predicted Zn-dependent protease
VAILSQQEAGKTVAPRRRAVAAVALLAAAGLGVFFGWRWLGDRAERREAMRAVEQGRFSEAEPLLVRLAQRHPDDVAVVKELALGYLRANRLPEAEPYFQAWCAAQPGEAEPLRQRITLWLQWSRLQEAADDAGAVLKLEPNNHPLRQQRARWLLMMGRFEEAERECRRLLEVSPDNPWTLLIQATLRQRQGRLAEATAVADRLVRDHPDGFPEASLLRAQLYLAADQPGEAVPWLRRAAIAPGPHRREALYELGLALARTGQDEEARRVIAEARALQEVESLRDVEASSGGASRANVHVQVRAAGELLNAGQAEAALRILAKLLQQDPDCPDAHRLLAAYYDKQGQPERAADHRRRAKP